MIFLAVLSLAGCGEDEGSSSPAGETGAAERSTTGAETGATTGAATITGSTGGTAGDTAASGTRLTVGDPAGLPGDPVPVEFLPEGFVLPAEASVVRGNGEYRPETGQFYLEMDAPLEEIRRFFEEQYPANGWAEISSASSERDGAAGFDLLYGKNNSQTNAGFTAEEREGITVVQVYYKN